MSLPEGIEVIVTVNGYRKTIDQAVEDYRINLEATAKREAARILRCEERGWPDNEQATGGRLEYSVRAKRQDPITRLGNLGRD